MVRVVDPVAAQLPEILKSIPENVPIVMLNLLRFRDRAAYREGTFEGSGREAYLRYLEVANQKVREVGGEAFFMSRAVGAVIAPADELWHEVLLVRYPSIDAFATMLAAKDYRAVTFHRTAALEDARLIATIEHAPFAG